MKGRGFSSKKRMGGWIGVLSIVGGIAGSIGQQDQQNKQNKNQYQTQSDLSNLSFQQQDWLAQQNRKWQLQDYQTAQNYKQNAIAGFEKYAPANTADPNGAWQPPPKPVDMSGEMTGLAPTGPNGLPLIYDPKTGLPMDANAQVPQGTLPQVA